MSLHLFDAAVKLCANDGLVEDSQMRGKDLFDRRADHADYLHAVHARLRTVDELDRSRRSEPAS